MSDPTPAPADYAQWLAEETRRKDTSSARKSDGIEFSELMANLAAMPPETQAEKDEREKRLANFAKDDRIQKFRRICPTEFMCSVKRDLLPDPAAFDRVAQWDGSFPGPLATGRTDTAKTRAAWSALAHQHIKNERTFAWFPVKRLITEFAQYESKNLADEFWRNYRSYRVLFVDDLDKFNAQFESEGAAIFQFYDWIYREHIPCITTTNKDRAWWSKFMGDAFARRLFNDAHFEVKF